MMSNDEYLTNPCSHGETGACIQCIIQEDPDLDQIAGGIENENPDTTEAQEIRELALREIPPVLAGRMDLAHYFLKRDDGIDLHGAEGRIQCDLRDEELRTSASPSGQRSGYPEG